MKAERSLTTDNITAGPVGKEGLGVLGVIQGQTIQVKHAKDY
jgi:hypothetical protein